MDKPLFGTAIADNTDNSRECAIQRFQRPCFHAAHDAHACFSHQRNPALQIKKVDDFTVPTQTLAANHQYSGQD